jgi:hypothetical protein
MQMIHDTSLLDGENTKGGRRRSPPSRHGTRLSGIRSQRAVMCAAARGLRSARRWRGSSQGFPHGLVLVWKALRDGLDIALAMRGSGATGRKSPTTSSGFLPFPRRLGCWDEQAQCDYRFASSAEAVGRSRTFLPGPARDSVLPGTSKHEHEPRTASKCCANVRPDAGWRRKQWRPRSPARPRRICDQGDRVNDDFITCGTASQNRSRPPRVRSRRRRSARAVRRPATRSRRRRSLRRAKRTP